MDIRTYDRYDEAEVLALYESVAYLLKKHKRILSMSKKPYKANCNAVRHETKRLPNFTKSSMRIMFRAR